MIRVARVSGLLGKSQASADISSKNNAIVSENDLLSAAVGQGQATGNTSDTPDADTLKEAERRFKAVAGSPASAPTALDWFVHHIRKHPGAERLQILAARIIEKSRDPRQAPAAWKALSQRFRGSAEAIRMDLRWTLRTAGEPAAQERLRSRFPAPPSTHQEYALYIQGCEEIGAFDEAERGLTAALRLWPEHDEIALVLARRFEARGRLDKAVKALEQVETAKGVSEAISQLKAQLNLRRFEAGTADGVHKNGASTELVALSRLLGLIAEQRQAPPAFNNSYVGSVLMLSGTLGSGGAERQMVNTAIGLQRCVDEARTLCGRDIIGPITVCVRSLVSRPGADFFRPHLQKEKVTTFEYASLPPASGTRANPNDILREHASLVRNLPGQMREGIERLTHVIQEMRPSVVHIWQDGAIFATVLAALLAGAPRIVLSLRTVPPTDRPSRMKPGYEVLYPALAKLPGVIFSANSFHGARRYADWLSVDPALIPVVHNGLSRLSDAGQPFDQKRVQDFDRTTPGAEFTLGSVMRFDENKRPYLWLDCAAAFFEKAPSARFILVGDGPLLETAKNYAGVLGIAARVLFVGESNSIGYWLKYMDGFLLTSQFEGLPNVLIEAQLAGVPVIATPAGGAAETVQHSRTGFILGEGAVDARAVAEVLDVVRSNKHLRAKHEADARQWAERAFSIEQMLETTVGLYTL